MVGQRKGRTDIFEDPLQKEQLLAIKNLPGKPLDRWGSTLEDILEDEDLMIWWVCVGFHVGWKGSGELLEFDLWSCCLAYLWHGVFVFEKGSTDVLLRYEPIEFCKFVRNPDRAKELSDLSFGILCVATNSHCNNNFLGAFIDIMVPPGTRGVYYSLTKLWPWKSL